MGLPEDKSELLNQLKIDKNQADRDEYTLKSTVITALLSAIASGVLVYWLMDRPDNQSEVAAATDRPLRADVTEPLNQPRLSDISQSSPAQELAKSKEILNASGYITARRIATVSAEIMGLIETVDVEEGMRVEQGQILARLDNAVASVNLQLAQGKVIVLPANVQSITADLKETERELTRITRLQSSSFSSEAELTSTQARLDKLTASLASAKADIHVARLEVSRQQELLQNHIIRAPFSGVVTVKNAQPGEIVAPSSAGGGFTRTGICTIVDMDSLEIEVDVNEAFIGRVFTGQRVIANLDAYSDWDIPASVIAIIPTADRAKATVRVRIQIGLNDPRILPDMGVKVAFLKA